MFASTIEHFARIGARLAPSWSPRLRQPFDLTIAIDRQGEVFTLKVRDHDSDFRVLQANRAARHLLLYAKAEDTVERFLCGHDERHWFVAGVPTAVSTVTAAKRALLPPALQGLPLTPTDLAHRHNAAYKRQGEWFFVPTAKDLSGKPILHGELLQRGARRGKPHLASELIRFGGQQVILCNGKEYSMAAWKVATESDSRLAKYRWERRMKDAEVYVRGRIRHADHATLVLEDWHRVYVNGEISSQNMSFYD